MSTEHRNILSYGLEGPEIGEDEELSKTPSTVPLDDHYNGHLVGGFRKRSRQDSLDFEERLNNVNREIGDPEDQHYSSKRPKASIAVGRMNHPSALVIHRVLCDHKRVEGEDHQDHPQGADYLDVPRFFANDTRGSPLRGKQPKAHNLDSFAED
jgi:hypothetical protein